MQFQIDTRDFDDFRDELRTWKTCGSFDNRPPPLIIEVYLDTSELATSQTLVVIDEHGKRWDVAEALASSGSSGSDQPPGPTRRGTDVILERWRMDLKTTAHDNDDFGPILPTIYKKAIVFFRTLYMETRLSPCWTFAQHSKQKDMHPALRPRCRIKTSESVPRGADGLRHPLYNTNRPVFDEFVLGDLEIPVGRLYASVAYRKDLNFRVDDSEKLLSSRFMGADEALFRPSLPQSLGRRSDAFGDSQRHDSRSPAPTQPYGSLSTFHGPDAPGTSPMSALNAMRVPGSDTSSPPASAPPTTEPDPPHSVPIASGVGVPVRPPTRPTGDHTPRRPSVSFQPGKHPFKAGSLSGSPVPRSHEGHEPPPSPQSQSRVAGIPALTQPRNRSSLTAGMPASLRGPAQPPSHTPTPSTQEPISGSPRPGSTASRYSSSFTHRRGRSSFSSGMNKALDDDQLSSGRQSVSSSVVQPGSGLLAEAGGTSSGSLQTDDDNISDFLKALDSKKSLKSFESSKRAESATNRAVAQLSKFHMMKDTNNQLTESMSSSMQLQRSLSSSSRQLTSVPGMVAPASLSASSSPGKPLSPHTPHTPAVPSRLSENSVASYGTERRASGSHRRPAQSRVPSGPSQESTVTQDRVAAIDIPLSPRATSHGRRPSSAAQQPRTVSTDDDDGDLPFAHRSISLGADREPPTRSMMQALRGGAEEAVADEGSSASHGLGPAVNIRAKESTETMGQASGDGRSSGSMAAPSPSSPFGRRRYMGMAHAAGRGQTPPPSRGTYAGAGTNRQSRAENDDEEPLLFVMSEMDATRRSLEEGRGMGSGPGARRW